MKAEKKLKTSEKAREPRVYKLDAEAAMEDKVDEALDFSDEDHDVDSVSSDQRPPPPSPEKKSRGNLTESAAREDADSSGSEELVICGRLTQSRLHQQHVQQQDFRRHKSPKSTSTAATSKTVRQPSLLDDLLAKKEWRKGEEFRIKTPVKNAALQMSREDSRCQLKRKQQALTDLNNRIREMEVGTLSQHMSQSIRSTAENSHAAKDIPVKRITRSESLDPRIRAAYTSTSSSDQRPVQYRGVLEGKEKDSGQIFELERSLSSKSYGRSNCLLQRRYPRTASSSINSTVSEAAPSRDERSSKAKADYRRRFIQNVSINGPIQMSLYSNRGPFLRPLIGKSPPRLWGDFQQNAESLLALRTSGEPLRQKLLKERNERLIEDDNRKSSSPSFRKKNVK